jgi:CPA2 family monovalent cation:H+ antiporter-2
MNAVLISLCQVCLVILALIFLLRKVKQPYIVAYMLAGILLGPQVAGTIVNTREIEAIGEIGILLLMFFLGMEVDVPDSRSRLARPVTMQLIKIILSVLFAFLAGRLVKWPLALIMLTAMLFIFNSTAVVTEYLRKNGELSTPLGQTILNILVFQDVLLAPAIMVLQFWGNGTAAPGRLILPVVISTLVILLFRYMRNRGRFRPPFSLQAVHRDHDLQVFAGLFICIGFGVVAELAGMSSALGSFLAGIIIGKMKAFNWLERSLLPFKVFFTALFFLSVGLRLDVLYITANYATVLTATLLVLISNCLLSAVAFRILKYQWKESFYGGALLSQTGEFGILVLSLAYKSGIISYDFFKAGIAITALSLLISTVWISVFRRFFYQPRLA